MLPSHNRLAESLRLGSKIADTSDQLKRHEKSSSMSSSLKNKSNSLYGSYVSEKQSYVYGSKGATDSKFKVINAELPIRPTSGRLFSNSTKSIKQGDSFSHRNSGYTSVKQSMG